MFTKNIAAICRAGVLRACCWSCSYTLRTAITALWPPKPNELLSAAMLPAAGRGRS